MHLMSLLGTTPTHASRSVGRSIEPRPTGICTVKLQGLVKDMAQKALGKKGERERKKSSHGWGESLPVARGQPLVTRQRV